MKILFTHRNGAPGRVLTPLLDRLRVLRGTGDLDAEFLLEHDDGIGRALAPYGAVHVEPHRARLRKLVDARRYDAVVAIDTEAHIVLGRAGSPGGAIVPSDSARRRLASGRGVADADIRVVPPSVDPAVFRPLPVEERARRPIVLWVGCLDEHERWVGFGETAALLSIATSDVDFWLVGEDAPTEETTLCLLGTVEASGLSSRFRWFPRIEYGAMPGVYSYVRASGGALLVSGQDGTPVAEALLAGCPVVASRGGAIPEIGGDRPYLRLYPLGDSGGASRMLQRSLFDDHDLVCHTLAADRAGLVARWSPEATAPAYLGALRELAALRS